MSSRAIAFYQVNPPPELLTNGNFLVACVGLYNDPAVPGKKAVLTTNVELDSSAPGGWTAAIKTAMTQTGVDNGFPDLVSTSVFVPTYA